MTLYTVLNGLADSLFSIAIVYAMLYLLSLAIRPLKYLTRKEELPETQETPLPETKAFGLEDIKDEDMMVATLVASIDARETLKTDVVVKSVKEIK